MIDPEDNQDTSLIRRSTLCIRPKKPKTLHRQTAELLRRDVRTTLGVAITQVLYQIP